MDYIAPTLAVVVIALALVAIWPPRWVPKTFRRRTRWLRRRVRRKRYDYFR